MGISGLIPTVEDAFTACHIKQFSGSTILVDSYCFLHKGAFACSDQLMSGIETNIYVNYCLKYVNMFLSFGIKPIMVFDGQHLVAKKCTEEKRRKNRILARTRAKELMSLGKCADAKRLYKQCIDITHKMALNLIKECHKLKVDCIVAPYEADAQLAYLNLQGIGDVVVTEDSDLIMFGCTKVIFKLDLKGEAKLFVKEKLSQALKMKSDDVYMFEKFQHMCILSGCDYLESISGIGLKRARKAVDLNYNSNITYLLRRLPQQLNMPTLKVSSEYIEEFKLADATLKHQVVYDPIKRKLVHLNPIETFGINPEYLKNVGDMYDTQKAFQMALGNIDPITLKVIYGWDPSTSNLPVHSIWSNEHAIMDYKSTKEVNKLTFVDNKETHKQEKIDYDHKLAEELKSYYKPKNVILCSNDQIPEIRKCETSDAVYEQIKLNNPFLVSKPLSKFSTTILPEGKIVRSRFFKKDSASILTEIEDYNNGQKNNVKIQYDNNIKNEVTKFHNCAAAVSPLSINLHSESRNISVCNKSSTIPDKTLFSVEEQDGSLKRCDEDLIIKENVVINDSNSIPETQNCDSKALHHQNSISSQKHNKSIHRKTALLGKRKLNTPTIPELFRKMTKNNNTNK